MNSLKKSIEIYKEQICHGDIRIAYRIIIGFSQKFRASLQTKYPDYVVSGNIYQGYMDMSYFAFTPKTLASQKLKIALVFIHKNISFELWLSAVNKQVQQEFWQLLKNRSIEDTIILEDIKGQDYILYKLVDFQADFDHPDEMMLKLESEILKFIELVGKEIKEM